MSEIRKKVVSYYLALPNHIIAALIFAALAFFLLLRNALTPSPIYGGDEYAYYIAGFGFPDEMPLYLRDPHLQVSSNTLFFGLIRLGFYLSRYPEGFIKLINAFLFMAGTGGYFLVARRFATPRAALAALAVMALLPFSIYADAVMPDMLYFAMTSALTVSLVTYMPARPLKAACVAGILLGLMVLTKPHAVALVAAVAATFVGTGFLRQPVGLRWPVVLRALVIFMGALSATSFLVKFVMTGIVETSIVNLLGRGYIGDVMRGINWNDAPRGFVEGAVGYLALVLMIAAPAVTYGWLRVAQSGFGWRQAEGKVEAKTEGPLACFVIFTSFAFLVVIAMILYFTANISYLSDVEWRTVQARYYEFLMPLLIVLLAAMPAGRMNVRAFQALRTGGIVILLAVLFWVVFGRSYFLLQPWTIATMQALNSVYGNGIPSKLFLGLIFCGGVGIIWRPQYARTITLIITAVLWVCGGILVTQWQGKVVHSTATLTQQARAIAELLPPAERDKGVVIGTNRYGPMAYSLFGFATNNYVVVKDDEKTEVKPADIPPSAHWVLVLGKLPVRFSAAPSIQGPDVRFWQLRPKAKP